MTFRNGHLAILGAVILIILVMRLSLAETGSNPINPGHPLSQTWIDTDLNTGGYRVLSSGGLSATVTTPIIAVYGYGNNPAAYAGYFEGGRGVFVGGSTNITGNVDVGRIQTQGNRMYVNGFDGSNNFWFRTTGAEPGSVFLSFGATAGGNAQWVQISPGGNLGVYVTNAGNVGVGTSNPGSAKLNVSGNIYSSGDVCIPGKCLSSAGGGGGGGAGWSTAAGPIVYNNTAGVKVGIGTNQPARALHVVGNITVSDGNLPRSDIYWDSVNSRLVIKVT